MRATITARIAATTHLQGERSAGGQTAGTARGVTAGAGATSGIAAGVPVPAGTVPAAGGGVASGVGGGGVRGVPASGAPAARRVIVVLGEAVVVDPADGPPDGGGVPEGTIGVSGDCRRLVSLPYHLPPHQDESWSRLGTPRHTLCTADPFVGGNRGLTNPRFVAQIGITATGFPWL